MSASLLVRNGWTPLRWQNEALGAIRLALIDPSGPQWQSGVVIAATGCGKATEIAGLAVQHALRGGRVVIVVDRENLVMGLYNDVAAVAKDHGLVGRVADLDHGRFVPNRATGSSPLVGMSMATRNELAHPIVVASIQSLSQPGRLAAMGWTSLLITDEAHGATAPTHRALHARIAELYPKWKHVGMTATAYRGDGSEGLGGDESTFTFDAVPFTGPPRRPDSPGAFAWAAEQVTAWCAANKWGGRCVAVRAGDVEMLKLEATTDAFDDAADGGAALIEGTPIKIARRFCRCARGQAMKAGAALVPDIACNLCDASGRSLSPALDELLDRSYAFNLVHPEGANRVAMCRAYYNTVRREIRTTMPSTPLADGWLCGLRVDIDSDASLPAVSRVEEP